MFFLIERTQDFFGLARKGDIAGIKKLIKDKQVTLNIQDKR